MKRYQFINNVMGWVAFAIAAITYILTTEASASFWDCGEFISTADKLLVGHPPGAPFFMIFGRLFAILAPDVTLVAKFINIMSALFSALTILFLFWTITHLARKLVIDEHVDAEGNVETWRTWAVMAAGMVGALAYTFSDTFWFSAVEGEVYAMSSFFTAIVFWAMLKWEDVADEPGSNRWLVLIAYFVGLSIGVHLLNLLCIPAMGLIYYFRKYTPTRRGTIIAFLVSCVILAVVLYGVIPGLVALAGYFELAFVNGLGLPQNSGAIFFLLLIVAGIIWGVIYTLRKGKVLANTIITCFMVIVLGYSCFAMVVIRSAADPTMDQNSPDNVFALEKYLNREQYGGRPLFYGQTFASPMKRTSSDDKSGTPYYVYKNGKYEVGEYTRTPEYLGNVLFPRMYSAADQHVSQYKSWSNFKGTPVVVRDENGQAQTIMQPTFAENLRFFFSYQVNFMYIRYFMWNFCGRQNDIQSNGELTHGNWITGIPAIDNMMLGDQDLLPDSLKNNRGHNTYFMLPLLLGLLGLFWHAGRGKKGMQDFGIVMLLFFMTGLAIVVYLNQTPLQPRERDYAYAGSFYAFAIWIGLGVLQLIEWLNKIKKLPRIASVGIAGVLSLIFVPGIMAQQNWDDHDRSGCTIARDIAYNYLNSLDDNAVIFTNGDNDTFPLWYVQEVEGARPDVRICNLSYLQTDWYCDQMKRKAYDSEPLPISFTHEQYSYDRDVVYLYDKTKESIDLRETYKFIKSEDPRTKRIQGYEGRIVYAPGRKFYLDIDKETILKNKVVAEKDSDLIVDRMNISFGGSYFLKNALMVLDMIQTANWERPLYYAVTVGSDNYFGLESYFRLEGLAYRISPVYGPKDPATGNSGTVDTEKMYYNVMNRFRWGFYNDPDIYLDENKIRMASNLRGNLSRLAKTFLNEADSAANDSIKADKIQKAVNILDKEEYELPSDLIPHNYFSLDIAESYYRAGQIEKADKIMKDMARENYQELNFYVNLSPQRIVANSQNIYKCATIYNIIARNCDKYERYDLLEELEKENAAIMEFAYKILNL